MLTARKVTSLSMKPGNSISSDGGGLYFRKRKNSSSWVIRRTRNKVASFATIGRFPEMSLAAARKELDKFGNQSAENLTVAHLLDDWFDQNEKMWKRPKQMEGYIRRLTADDPHIVAMNIHVVDLMIVRRSLKNYAGNHGNVAANRLMEILKQVFKHAVQVGYLKYSPIVDLSHRHRAMDHQVSCRWHALHAHPLCSCWPWTHARPLTQSLLRHVLIPESPRRGPAVHGRSQGCTAHVPPGGNRTPYDSSWQH
jgi:hypothetical protein